MSNIDKRALREAAEKATPGRWEYYPGNTSIEYNVDSMDEDQGSIVYVDSGDFTQKQTDLNGTYIAAANPATVLALLDELEAKDRRITEKAEIIAKQEKWIKGIEETMIAATDRAEAAEKRIAELEDLLFSEIRLWTQRYDAANGRRGAAEKRVAELEARHSKLRESMAAIHNTIRRDGAHTSLAVILNAAKRAHDESAAAGRINGEG